MTLPSRFIEITQRISAYVDRRWLSSLVIGDLLFVLFHLAHQRWWPEERMFSLMQDRSYAEMFQYCKTLTIALLLGDLARRQRDNLWLMWSVLFTYLLLDDILGIHEGIGVWLTDHCSTFAAADELGHAFGELAYFAILGSAWTIGYVIILTRGHGLNTAHTELAALFSILVMFGAGADLLNSIGGGRGWRGLALLEGGGSMMSMSLIVAYVIPLTRKTCN